MTHEAWLHLFAIILLICVAIVGAIDLGWSTSTRWGIGLKWSILWYAARFVGVVCSLLLAADVLT